MTHTMIVALDGGLATGGRVAIATDGYEHRCLHVQAWSSPKAPNTKEIQRERIDRTRLLARWIEEIADWQPAVIACEELSFPRGAHAIAAVCLAWGVLASFVERYRIPLVTAGPMKWRRAITTDGGTEDAAHRAAVRIVPSFAPVARFTDRRMQEHVLDALGVFCWSLTTNEVRGAVMR